MSKWIYRNTTEAQRHPAAKMREFLRDHFGNSAVSLIGHTKYFGIEEGALGRYYGTVEFHKKVILNGLFDNNIRPAHLNGSNQREAVLYSLISYQDPDIFEWKFLMVFQPWKTGSGNTYLSCDPNTGEFVARAHLKNAHPTEVKPVLLGAALYGGDLHNDTKIVSAQERVYNNLSHRLHAHIESILKKNNPDFQLTKLQGEHDENMNKIRTMLSKNKRTSMASIRLLLYPFLVEHYPKSCSIDSVFELIERDAPLTQSDREPAGPNSSTPAWKRQVHNTIKKAREKGLIQTPSKSNYQATLALILQQLIPNFTTTPLPPQHHALVAYLKGKPQVIFSGPPGTGKTRLARQLALHLCLGKNGHGWTEDDAAIDRAFNALVSENRARLAVFHPSYEYSTFIGGMAVNPSDSEESSSAPFIEKDGVFLELVDHAKNTPAETFVLIIDEVNRGNLPRLFGELIYGLEYRNASISLSYKGLTEFQIPNNLLIIGTMNSADQSVAPLDVAVRRRFGFHRIEPDSNLLSTHKPADWKARKTVMTAINDALRPEHPDYLVGHSYFLKNIDTQPLWTFEVQPLLAEYRYRLGLEEHHLISQLCRCTQWSEVLDVPTIRGQLTPNG